MNRTFIPLIVLLMLSLAYSSLGQAIDSTAVQALNKLAESYKDEIINSTQELVKIKSVSGEPQPGAPFGEGPTLALNKTLEIAHNLGFKTTNLDGYIGYVEYGQGKEYIAVLYTPRRSSGWRRLDLTVRWCERSTMGRYTVEGAQMIRVRLWLPFTLSKPKDSNLSISKRVRLIFGTTEETGDGDIKYYLKKEAPPVSGFTPDANFPAIYAEKGSLIFDIVKDTKKVPTKIEIVSIQVWNGCKYRSR